MKYFFFAVLFYFNYTSGSAQVDLNAGLLAYYPFSGNVNDATSNNNNPSFNNTTYTNDRLGNPSSACHFNGIDNYIEIPGSASLNTLNQASFCAWVKAGDYYQGPCHGNSIIEKGNPGGFSAGDFILRFDDNFYVSGTNCSNPTVGEVHQNFYGAYLTLPSPGYTPYVQTSQWMSVVYTYDGTTAKLFVNCELKMSANISGINFSNNFSLFLGHLSSPAFPYWFNGDLDEVRVYNRALNDDEVRVYSGCSVVTTTSFTAPDTVCVNTNVPVANTSTGTSNYYWTFCETDFPSTPVATNLGNIGSVLTWPVFNDLVEDNGNLYGFVVNNSPSGLTRYNYGNSYLNTPTVDFLGNVGGTLPGNAEGIQVVKVNGNWIAVIVGGAPASGNNSELVTINFGPLITNNVPVGTNWGNVGNLLYPIDLIVFQNNNNWYGYTINSDNNTLTRFSFGDFSSPPTAVNLGNIGGMDEPVGMGEVSDGTNWYIFVTNEGPTNSLTRLDFGNSLLSNPTGINLGNPGGLFHKPRDISFINLCDGISALSVNGETNNITKLNFQNNLLGAPVASNLGNLGTLNFPHSISELFRVNNDIYAFIPNVFNNTLTRLQFPGTCTSMPSSFLQNPSAVTYTQPGIYNIHLVTDIGLSTQGSFCKQIVVRDCAAPDSTIINDYTPVLALNPCNNSITVEDATEFNVGDTVLLIQMKGASIDVTNTSSFGNVLDYHNAGNYEYNYISQKSGNILSLKNRLTRQYDIPDGKVQLVRVPYFQASVSFSSTLTCLSWDGSKGGILAFNVRDTLTLNKNIDVTGKGFKGGTANNTTFLNTNCFQTDYFFPDNSILGARKGENIANMPFDKTKGRGAPSNGGGGGLDHNSGGGGGSNVTLGGLGGYQWENCGGAPFDNRGLGGHALTYSNSLNKVFMGGGGGAGHYNNATFNPTGASGGGLIFIKTDKIIANGNRIFANGASAQNCVTPASDQTYCHEAMGGGGGGGSVLLDIATAVDNISVITNGGNGADMSGIFSGRLGPGGGGGGGVVWLSTSTIPANILIQNNGGLNGICTDSGGDPWGATPGENGVNLFDLAMPNDTILFTPNIDSVRIKDSVTSCSTFDFHGFGYTNSNPVISWLWDFGDSNTDTNQNTSHNYSTAGTYNVTLVATDMNGCKDSATIDINTSVVTVNAGTDTAYCSNSPIIHTLHGNTSGSGYLWQPAALLNNNTLQNPTATVPVTTTFYLISSGINGCIVIDSVKISVNPKPAVSTINDIIICRGDQLQLLSNSTAQNNQWTPALSVNNPGILSPNFTDTISQQLIITGTNNTGCFTRDTINVIVKPVPVVETIADTAICGVHALTFNTTGASSYSWSPGTGLNNPGLASPEFTGSATQTYTVTGTAANGCSGKDSVTITVNANPLVSTINDIIICRGDQLHLLTNSNAQSNHWIPSLSVNDPNAISPNFTDTISQQMIITGTNTTGCVSADTVNITVKTIPFVRTIPDTSLCGAQPITLNTTGAPAYTWSPPGDLSNAGSDNPVFTGNATQTYTVTGTASNGCSAKDTVTITINAIPVISTINSTTICRGDYLQLNTNSNAETNHWSPPLSVNDPNTISPNFTDTVSQTLTITGTNTSTGCFSVATVDIIIKPLPDVKSIEDFTSCAVNTVTLSTTGAQSYSWNPATNLDDAISANPVFTGPPGTYTYYVTGTGANACIAKDTVHITIANKPIFITPENKTVCSQQWVQLDGNNGPSWQYQWTPAAGLNNPGIVNPIANPTATVTYTLLISDQLCHYDSSFLVTVIVNPLPVINATNSNNLDCAKSVSHLLATGATQYNWSPATGLSNSTIHNPTASPNATTIYVVTGTDNNGCSNRDTVTVTVKGGRYFGFNIPNSFTPNNDNLNDCFGVSYWGETKNFTLRIYDRWGEKVFESHNISDCWDGRRKGQPADADNYVYYLTGETFCGPVYRKGNVLLIR